MSKNGFTLSEILITLGVIGVVAVMTLPTLVKNYKKHVVETRLKSAYSIFSQAINMAKTEHGDISEWDSTLNDLEITQKYFLPYLDNPKPITKWSTYFFTYTLYGNPYSYFYLHGADVKRNPDCQAYMLSNGMAFVIKNNLNAWNFGYPLIITVDINGSKGPNTLGYDSFVFQVTKTKSQLLPRMYGYSVSDLSNSQVWGACAKDATSGQYYMGEGCASLIMKNNWKIPDNYIW